MNKISKQKILANYSELIAASNTLLLVKNLKMSVMDSQAIRSQLKQADSAIFMVVKNSLLKIAIRNTKFAGIEDKLHGPICVVFAKEPVSSSKATVDFCQRNNSKLQIVGGAMLEQTLDEATVLQLSKMATHDELRALIVALLYSVATKVSRVAYAPSTKLLRVMGAHIEKIK